MLRRTLLVVGVMSCMAMGCATSSSQQAQKNSDSVASPCANGGKVHITGTVGDVNMALLKTAFFFESPLGGLIFAFREEGRVCFKGDSVSVVAIVCGDAARGYTITSGGPKCGADKTVGYVVAERRDGVDLGTGKGGSLTVTHRSKSCLAGTFDMKLDGGAVKGSFAATKCKPPAKL